MLLGIGIGLLVFMGICVMLIIGAIKRSKDGKKN